MRFRESIRHPYFLLMIHTEYTLIKRRRGLRHPRTYVPNQSLPPPLSSLPRYIIFLMRNVMESWRMSQAPSTVVETTRREFCPNSPRSHAHLTILPLAPPRSSHRTRALSPSPARRANGRSRSPSARSPPPSRNAHRLCRVDEGAEPMGVLHRVLNTGPFTWKESWPYVPHVTIVRMNTPGEAETRPPAGQRTLAGLRRSTHRAGYRTRLRPRGGDLNLGRLRPRSIIQGL